MVSEFRFIKTKKKIKMHGKVEIIMFVCISDPIFSSIFLHAVTSSHVLHLDVIRSQIELKLKVKTEISLCMAIIQNNPFAIPIYTALYRTAP